VMPDLLGGRLDAAFDNVLILAPYIRKGQLRGLGVTSAKRSVVFPELPTLAETGLPGFHAVGWFGVFAVARTPTIHRDQAQYGDFGAHEGAGDTRPPACAGRGTAARFA